MILSSDACILLNGKKTKVSDFYIYDRNYFFTEFGNKIKFSLTNLVFHMKLSLTKLEFHIQLSITNLVFHIKLSDKIFEAVFGVCIITRLYRKPIDHSPLHAKYRLTVRLQRNDR